MRPAICILFVAILFCDPVSAQKTDKLALTYKSTAEIYKANREGPGFCIAFDDTMSFSAAGKDFFVFYWDCTSGLYSTTIVMFATNARENEWKLWYESQRYSGRVRGEVDDKGQQITFMSETRKPVLTLPLAKQER